MIDERATASGSGRVRACTQIKICGFTEPDDACHAAEQGAHAIGLVFYPPSPRYVTVEQATAIAVALPPFACVTALFLNPHAQHVQRVLETVPVSLLQFHGAETDAFCRSFGRPYIKSVPMKSVATVQSYCLDYPAARGFLLDSNVAGSAGGTGEAFDWNLIPRDIPTSMILAGGLNSGNVAEAIAAVQPVAVDVSSGVERARGVKDRQLVIEFISQVKHADKLRAA